MSETRSHSNFIRLAEKRTSRILKDLELLGNLANRSNYSYKEPEVRLIFKTIAQSVSDAETRFAIGLKPKDGCKPFKLDVQ